MGRRKKIETDPKSEIIGYRNLKFDIASEAKRGIVGVFLITLAVLVILGFLEKAGMVGEKLNFYASLSIGWAKLVLPIFLAIAGIIMFFREKNSFYFFKILGLLMMLLSFTGFLHWFFEPEQMLETAKQGMGGGYAGYIVALYTLKYLGKAGSAVIFVALFLTGIILTFNFSMAGLFNKLKNQKDEKEETKDIVKVDEKTLIPTVVPETKVEEKKEDEKNIGKIEFVEGPDRFANPISEIRPKLNKLMKKGFTSRKINNGSGDWNFPSADLLEKSSGVAKAGDVKGNAEIIQKTLKHFGIDVEIGEIKTGPSVTQYSFRPAVGVKIAKILALQNDISLALALHPIRIEAPIPGKSLIGIEVPNKDKTIVRLRDIIESDDFASRNSSLTIAMGQDVNGSFILGNLDKMPHLMIAGATGTGKSVCINSIITTLLYQNSPKDMRMILVDPKRVELSLYNKIPHLLSDVIVDNGKVVGALKWAVGEMERRYRLLQDASSRDINSYNEKVKDGKKREFKDPETGEKREEEYEKLPYIVIIIDELADLMGSHGKEVEGAIVRLAQMARAVGIHLIVSTQRPEVKVITGLIKANITTRIAFQVATQIDSRTIIDMAGAEKLLGNGDLLYLSAASPKPKRIQGVFVSESEVKRVVKFIKAQKIESEEETIESEFSNSGSNLSPVNPSFDFENVDDSRQDDELYEAAKEEVIRAGKASTSFLQRRLKVGYARAARLMDILEENGIVGPSDGAKPREIIGGSQGLSQPGYEDPLKDQEKRDKWQF